MRLERIPEYKVEGRRLGRHVEHDERSREFPFMAPRRAELRTVRHRRYGPNLNQQSLGACTGFAAAGAINTVPIHRKGAHLVKEQGARDIYSLATALDDFDGAWPDQDTGSSGLAAAKAAAQLGHIREYRWAFGIDDALQALQHAPVITGTEWREGMDTPDGRGFVWAGGQVRGGHEYEVVAYVAARPDYVECVNSWGRGWGLRGRFRLYVADWADLLDADGDVTVLVR